MRLTTLLLLLALLLPALTSCNKYGDHEVKTPLPPEPRATN